MPAPTQVQAATLKRFLDSWKEWSAEGMLATFADDFEQQNLPSSLHAPAHSRAEVDAILPKLVGTIGNYELNICHVVHDAERGKAAVYATSKGDVPFDGDWSSDYAVFLTFDERGEKITRMDEMLDSAFVTGFLPKMQQYLAGRGASGETE